MKKNEFQRRQDAHIIYPLINQLNNLLLELNFPLPLKNENGKFFVLFDNIWLCVDSEYYLKNNMESKSIGSMLSDLLIKFNIKPLIVVDIGANEGECSIVLSKLYPSCKVYAIEPSTRTFHTLAANCAAQQFSTSNIVLSNLAISDKNSEVIMSCGKAQENSIIDNLIDSDNSEIVNSLTLSSYLKIMGIRNTEIDCIKIDIEGFEPLLFESLRESLPNIRSLLIECSKKSPLSDYMTLFNLIIDNDFSIITEWGRSTLPNSTALEEYLTNLMWSANSDCGAVDVFFKKN
jgi:FkbM family methyltransferase